MATMYCALAILMERRSIFRKNAGPQGAQQISHMGRCEHEHEGPVRTVPFSSLLRDGGQSSEQGKREELPSAIVN